MQPYSKYRVLDALVKARKEAGFTQQGVEATLEWRKGTVHDLESGRLALSVESCWRLLDLFGKDWSIFDVSETPLQPTVLSPSITPLAEIGMLSSKANDAIANMKSDPLIITEIGTSADDERPMLVRLMEKMTTVQARDFFLELGRYVNATITADSKISQVERNFAEVLIQNSQLSLSEREKNSLRRCLGKTYLGGSIEKKFPRNSLKYFLIWVLFLVAICDDELNHHEISYIEHVAAHIGLPHEQLMTIKRQVV
ncbi:MAG: helix-turn-helix transcriptional regulator [Pseudobacteriovorax sp.]|nr:helix-turn-helix transcriptional regulator [Pseudobacteriovorax sp.]